MDMQTDAQIRDSTTQTGCFFTAGQSDKQARARQDTLTVGCDDPAIDPMTGTEVIPIDDEILHRNPPLWANMNYSGSMFLLCRIPMPKMHIIQLVNTSAQQRNSP